MLGIVFYVSIVIGNKVNIGSLKKYLIKVNGENRDEGENTSINL